MFSYLYVILCKGAQQGTEGNVSLEDEKERI